jgi:putative transposase
MDQALDVEGLNQPLHHQFISAYDSQLLQSYFKFYNEKHPHSALDGLTPIAVYFGLLPLQQAA